MLLQSATALWRNTCSAVKSDCGTPLVVEYNAEIQRAAYLNYKADVREKRAKNDEPDVKKKSTKRRVKFAVASALIVVFSVAAVIASPLLTDRFSASYVSRFKGKRIEDSGLGAQLGAPSVVRNIGEDSAVLEYYSDNYREIIEKISKLEKQAEKSETDGDLEKFMAITAQIDSLKKRALTTTYQRCPCTSTNIFIGAAMAIIIMKSIRSTTLRTNIRSTTRRLRG